MELDSTSFAYVLRSQRDVIALDSTAYREARHRSDLHDDWRSLAEERQQQDTERGGMGINIDIPGDHQSAFSTIFGTPEVDLRVTGQADIDAGFDYRQSDEQEAITGQSGRIDPDFKQDLRMGITGTIGDKMQVDVDWDTNNQFDFQNQLRLEYSGYEDEILQSVEAGNVRLDTPSSLIRGGQSLFGIKSEFQFGDLNLTAIASQQEGQSETLNIEGGSETTEFSLRPAEYEENTHFLLSYYFRNRWEEALSDPPDITLSDGFQRVTDIEVWKLQTSADPDEENVRRAVATVDLGEPVEILTEADDFTEAVLPRSADDQYSEADLEALRDSDSPTAPSTFLTEELSQQPLSDSDFQVGNFKRLEENRDYTLDNRLGYLSLNQRLRSNEAIAVAFRYRAGGQTERIGDFSSEAGGSSGGQDADRLVLKLLQPSNITQPTENRNPAAWYLQLRNIYGLSGSGFTADNFDFDIEHAPSGQSSTSSTVSEIDSRTTLLQMLGLDRLNSSNAPQPNDEFDFLRGFTINPQEGFLIFPYLEPFGSRLGEVIDERSATGEESEALREDFAFPELYRLKRDNAQRESRFDIYRMEGEHRGGGQDFFDLEAFAGVVEGSVEVRSGGTTLQEGADYIVDYQGGTVTITNPTYLSDGRDLEISYEQNALSTVQQKTLLGARADYSMRDQFSLGGTVMRLSEQVPVDKFRIGEEPISNTIWGLDGSLDLEPRWLTDAVDALPLVQTRSSSYLSVSGEFAQLNPGHSQSSAFDRARDNLQDQGRDFSSDELDGISYIDDFEGFTNTFSLDSQLDAWTVSAAPDSIGRVPAGSSVQDDSMRTNWRASLGWYRLNQNIVDDLSGKADAYNPDAVRLVNVNEVFPNRDTQGEADPTLRTFDMYFDPHKRGPYNFTGALDEFIDNPKDTWGGITRHLPESYTDFDVQNVEFVEFIFKPYPENVQEDAGEDAKLYLDLGTISEDVIPNRRLNAEDGLTISGASDRDFDAWGRLPGGQENSAIDIDGNRTQDLGLNGLVSHNEEAYPAEMRESVFYSDFLDGLPAGGDSRLMAEVARTQSDPAADEYHHYNNDAFFENEEYFPGGASFQERLSRYQAGFELNTYEAQNELGMGSVRRGVTRQPDSEDLSGTGVVNTSNDYFQYEIPLSEERLDDLAHPDSTDNFITGEIEDEEGRGTGWYVARVPVEDYDRRVGDIENFNLIEYMRLWTTGHEVPMTLRFASMDLVGSQWRNSESVAEEEDPNRDQDNHSEPELSISNINNEEDAIYRSPPGAIVGQQRTARGGQQNLREQSLLLNASDLGAGRQLGVSRTFNQGLDLLRYSNLRMHVHLHGTLESGRNLSDLDEAEARDKARLFVRLGSNETNDYYEYEQPLTPTRPTVGDAERLWRPEENGMNLVLSALNQLKVVRDQAESATPDDEVFWNKKDGELSPGAPDAESFAPEGTRIGIKGNPSLQNVTSVVIGVRHPGDVDDEVLESATLWLNELRVTGYDEEGGWAANANADIELADLGRVRGNIQRQTDGFGSLSSSLGEREQNDILNWSMTADLNADKLLPERYGWSIPLSMQLQSNTSTPRFAPNRGDVRLDEVVNQVDDRSDLEAEEREAQRQEVIRAAETRSYQRSFTARIEKRGSDSWLARNTLDALSLNFSYSESDSRNPSQRLDDSWRWSGTVNYRLSIQDARTVRPFWFLPDTFVLGSLSDLQFNYAPNSIDFSSSASRNFSQRRSRGSTLSAPDDDSPPDRISNPFRERQSFDHQRNFGLQHDPFEFLNLSFDTRTDQTFETAAVDTVRNVITDDGDVFRDIDDVEAFIDEDDALELGVNAFREERLNLLSEGEILSGIFSGDVSPRTDQHEQRFSATVRSNLLQGDAFDWIDLQDVTYQSTFRWRNSGVGRNTGATVSNQIDVRSGLSLRPERIWQRFEFYRDLEEQQRQSDRSSQRTTRNNSDEEEDDGPSVSSILPDPVGVLRRLFLTVAGINDLSVTYTASRSARSNNVGEFDDDGEVNVHHGLVDALRGDGPSLGYRFGWSRTIASHRRLFDTDRLDGSRQADDDFSSSNRLQGRTTLTPSQQLSINLNWNVDWSSGRNVTYRQDEDGTVDPFESEDGNASASTWAFGASFVDLFERQIETYRADVEAADNPAELGDESGDGRVVLTNESVTDDFQSAYLSGFGTIGGRGLMPFPMPGWDVNYSGLSSWPILDFLTQSITLRHGYNAEFSSRYRSVDGEPEGSFSLSGRTITYERPEFEIGSMRISERFQPLIGLDITWSGGLQTNISWNRSNSYQLSTTNFEVLENETNELTLSGSFRQRGISIPLLPIDRLENQISFNLSLSYSVNDETRLSMRRAIENAIARDDFSSDDVLDGESATPVRETSRLTVTPQISYQFSNRVSADFRLRYERFDGDSRRPSFTNVNGGFNVRVNIES